MGLRFFFIFLLDYNRSLFPALLEMPARTSDEKGVCLSVSLSVYSSVKRVHGSSINTNRMSTTRLPMSLKWSSNVANKLPPPGSKTQNGRFPCKNALCLKKVCYKVSLCENCQRQSCKAFIGLTIRAKVIGGGCPLLSENLVDDDPLICKLPIFYLLSPVAPKP